MANNILNIPLELRASIFGSCEDLDDALHLSHVCQNLRGVFQTHRRIIEKQIITSSHVYDYDFSLSKLLTMQEGLVDLYRNLGKQIPNGRKPDIRAFEACLLAKINKNGSTNAEIQKIIVRWRHFSFLRRLYADESVFREFESFRVAFASGLSPDQGIISVMPGLDNATVEASRINKFQSMQDSRFAGDFKARFHKILCLHSMAIISLHFAKISTVDPAARKPGDPDVAEMIDLLWRKEASFAGGSFTKFGLVTQLDGFEVFDFLYMFLLKKILSYQNLASWIGNDVGDHPFEWRATTGTNALEPLDWYSFLQECRKALQPDDLVGLIDSRAWAGWHYGPPNKSMYLRVRGIFERGDQNHLGFDWKSDFERWSMVTTLGPVSAYEEPLPDVPDVEEPCWWDELRLSYGSPFLAGSHKYQDFFNEMC